MPAAHPTKAAEVPHSHHLQLFRPARRCQQWAGEAAEGRPGAIWPGKVRLSNAPEAGVPDESMSGMSLLLGMGLEWGLGGVKDGCWMMTGVELGPRLRC